MSAGELHPDLGAVDVILKANHTQYAVRIWNIFVEICVKAALVCLYPRTADFGDDLPGFIEDRQPLGFWRVGTRQTATQRSKQQMLQRRKQ